MEIELNEALQFLNGQGGPATLSVEEYNNIIQPLSNQTYMWMVGRANDTKELHAGKYLYRVTYLPLSEKYAIGNVTKQAPVTDIIESKEITYSDASMVYEMFDYKLTKQAPQIVGNMLSNLTLAAYVEFSQYFYQSMKNYGDAHPEQTFYIPELGKEELISDDDAKKVQQLIAKRKAKIGRTINRKYVGVDLTRILTVIDPYAAIDLSIVLTRLNASSKAFEVSKNLIEGNAVDFEKIYTDNLINVAIPRGTSTRRDFDYDMTGVVGFMWDIQFMAMPVIMPQFVSRINGDGNTEFISKYGYTHAILRPELFCMLVNDLRAFIETKGADQYVKCNATFRDKTATYSSSDESIATVGTDGKITVVGTGEVTFTVTLGTATATVKKTF